MFPIPQEFKNFDEEKNWSGVFSIDPIIESLLSLWGFIQIWIK